MADAGAMSGTAKAIVRIALSGSRREDLRRAEDAYRSMLGDPRWTRPRGWIWHHLGDGTTLQLVPSPLHGTLPHSGSFTGSADRSVRILHTPASPLPLSGSRGPLPPATLEQLEDALETRLPEDYRSFLLRWNGGRPLAAAFRGEESGDECLDEFLGLAPGADDDLVAFLQRYGDRLPEGLLPIACDAFGNLVLLALTGPAAGSVFFWDHELEEDDGTLQRLAPSFGAFLGMFYEDGEP